MTDDESVPDAERRLVSSVEELRELIELTDIRYFDMSASRITDSVDEIDDEPHLTLNPLLATSGKRLKVEVTGRLRNEFTDLCVTVEAFYTFPEPVRFDNEQLIVDFMGQSTIVSVAPHIREAFQSMAARLRAPVPVIGLIRPVKLKPIDPDDTSIRQAEDDQLD